MLLYSLPGNTPKVRCLLVFVESVFLCNANNYMCKQLYTADDTVFYLASQKGQDLPPRKVTVLMTRKEVI